MVRIRIIVIAVLLVSASATCHAQRRDDGVETITFRDLENCIRLFNPTTSVVIDPATGGRVVEYALNDVDALYHAPKYPPEGVNAIMPDAGRFDIGPEQTSPRRVELWRGPYEVEITEPRSVRLTSRRDEKSTGVQLVRDFKLDPRTSHLACTQTIINISGSEKRYNHWSRTLAKGGGICIVPLTPEYSRFPLGYIYYEGGALKYRHEPHENIRVRDNYLELLGTPPQPKFGIDSYAGWFGYITTDDLLFVKKFPADSHRRYGEVAAYTISLWYYLNETCELEPIGPTEFLAPGGRASFTEDWWLLPYEYPEDKTVDLKSFEQYVTGNTN